VKKKSFEKSKNYPVERQYLTEINSKKREENNKKVKKFERG